MTHAHATAQLVLNATQAKIPSNKGIRQCGPKNHDNACYDPSLPNLMYHIYIHRRNCERDEGVPCAELYGLWVPIGKPVVTEE